MRASTLLVLACLSCTRAAPPPPEWGGLRVREVGEGDRVVVLLHGYGAPGNDLVPIALRISREAGYRVVLPEGPLASGGGRGWYEPRGSAHTEEQIAAARAALAGVLSTLRSRSAERPIVGGFSQGAILSLDLLLSTDQPIGGVIAFSGGVLPTWPSATPLRAPVFMSHGRADAILSFDHAQALSERLSQRGQVTFVPFDGGHDIPPEILERAIQFLRERRIPR